MKVFYTHKAAKQFENLPRAVQKRIAKKMRFYVSQKDPLKFSEHLTGHEEGEFRFRIGDYRVVFDVIKNTIYVLKIGKRDKIYE